MNASVNDNLSFLVVWNRLHHLSQPVSRSPALPLDCSLPPLVCPSQRSKVLTEMKNTEETQTPPIQRTHCVVETKATK